MFGKVDAVLFDLDDTLIDSQMGLVKAHEKVAESIRKLLLKRGIQIDLNKLTLKVSLIDDRMNRESQYDRDLWWPRLVDDIAPGTVLPSTVIHVLTNEYWKTYSENSPLYPDTISTLSYLRHRGYKLGLVSDTDGIPGLKASRVNGLQFRGFFSTIIIAGEDTRELKPNPAPFLKASKMLGVSNKSTVFVGDKPFTDIAGAREASMKTIRVWRRQWDSNVEADITIKSLKELTTIL